MEVAVCVPTRNHPQVVEDVLNQCMEDYLAYGIDIYYYDSSDNDETEVVIKQYREMGYDNLYYIHCLPEVDFIQKGAMILGGEGLKKKYDYIWPAKDRSYVSKDVLDEIFKAMDEQCDMIFLGIEQYHLQPKIYDKPQEFYRDWAWLATSLDLNIYRYDSMLADFNVEEFHQDEYHNKFWWNFAFIFNKLAKSDDSRVLALLGANIIVHNSDLGESSWTRDAFKIWKDYWIKVNDDLPESYNPYKASVIKMTASLPWILGDIPRLMELHDSGVLTDDKLDDILVDWERVSDVPAYKVKQIARGIYDNFHDVSLIRSANETTDLIIRFTTMLQEGKIAKEQMPFDDIEDCLLSEIAKNGKYPDETLYILEGTVRDLKQYMLKEETVREEACKAMQVLISFLLLIQEVEV